MANLPANRYRYLLTLDPYPADMLRVTNLEMEIDAWIERWNYKDCICTQGVSKYRFYIVTDVKPWAMRKRVQTTFRSHVGGAEGLSRRFGGMRYWLTQANLSQEEVLKAMLMGDSAAAAPHLVHCTWTYQRHPSDLHATFWAERRKHGDTIGPPVPPPRPPPRWSAYVSGTHSVAALNSVQDIMTAICAFHSQDNTPVPDQAQVQRLVAEIQEWVRLQRAAGLELCRTMGAVEEQREQRDLLGLQQAQLEKQREQMEQQREQMEQQREQMEKQRVQMEEQRAQMDKQQAHMERQQAHMERLQAQLQQQQLVQVQVHDLAPSQAEQGHEQKGQPAAQGSTTSTGAGGAPQSVRPVQARDDQLAQRTNRMMMTWEMAGDPAHEMAI